MQSQALSSLAKARPVATVFFRFSHRNNQNEYLPVQEQKDIVNKTRKTILDCQKNHALRLVVECMSLGVKTVRASQTRLEFFDVYSIVDQISADEAELAA